MDGTWKLGTHYTFIGQFDIISQKLDGRKRIKKLGWQMLLLNIVDSDGNEFRDHHWIPFTKKFKKLDLKKGDRIRLQAKVYYYRKFELQKGYGGTYLYNVETEDPDKVEWQIGLKNIIDIEVLPEGD